MAHQYTTTDVFTFQVKIIFELEPGDYPDTLKPVPKFVTVPAHPEFEFSRSVYRELAQAELDREYAGENYKVSLGPLGDMPDCTFDVYKKLDLTNKGK